MSISNTDFLNQLQASLSHIDKKTRKKNEKEFRNALKDLTQSQRAHVRLIFRGRVDVSDPIGDEICLALRNYQSARTQMDADGKIHTPVSVRIAPDVPRVKSRWKSFVRALSNLGSRISSKNLLKIIEKCQPLAPRAANPPHTLSHPHTPPQRNSVPPQPVKPVKIPETSVNLHSQENGFSFKHDQLKLFKAVLETQKIKDQGGVVAQIKRDDEMLNLIITYDADNMIINTQIFGELGDKDKIGLKIDGNGKIQALYIDGIEHKDDDGKKTFQIPDQYAPFILACYRESLKLSSNYRHNGYIQIKLVGEGLEEVPGFHLEQLTRIVAEQTNQQGGAYLTLKLKFIGHNLQDGQGIDAGGPAREYVDSLGRGFFNNPPVNINKKFGLAFPTAGEQLPDGAFFELTDQEKDVYLQMGQFLMFCYNSRENYATGQILAFPVVQAALSLNAAEIDKPFDKLNDQALKKMLQSIISSLVISNPGDGAAGILNNYNLALNLYDWKKGDPIPLDDVLKAAHGLMGNSSLGDEFIEHSYSEYMNEDTFIPDLEKIKANIEDFIGKAKQAIVTQNSDFMPPIVDYLACAHQLAVGMKSVCSPGTNNVSLKSQTWDRVFLHNANFNSKAQGSLDRNRISELIKQGSVFYQDPGHSIIKKKCQWLREWIETDATDQEVEGFLKFMTGSSSIAPGTQLTIGQMYGNTPMPTAHSCSNTIDFTNLYSGDDEYNDRTKEGFIKCMKTIIVKSGALFSMG